MSLSRPVKFPLLKLPFLCIECVIKSWNIVDIIVFVLFSKRSRQIVKQLKIPLNRVRIFLSTTEEIVLDSSYRKWYLRNESESESFFDGRQNLKKNSLVLQKNAVSLYTSKTDNALESYTDGNRLIAVKMALEFLSEVFRCSVERVDHFELPKPGDIGVKSTVNLSIDRQFGYGRSQELNLLLENLKVTGTCAFWMDSTETGFYVDPKLFKCKKLMLSSGSAAWVTREILLQFEVPQLKFLAVCPFSVEDITAFVTQWFHSDNKKLEYLNFYIQRTQFSLEEFQTEELNPVSFSERNRVPPSESFRDIDFSKGLEIVRHDGLAATIHVGRENFMFYIWHDQ